MSKQSKDAVIGVRLPSNVLEQLDAVVERRRAATPWADVTRADLLREATYKFLRDEATSNGYKSEPAPKAEAPPIRDPETGSLMSSPAPVPPRVELVQVEPKVKAPKVAEGGTERRCEQCGNPYTPKNAAAAVKARFCGDKCRFKAAAARKRKG